jgi:type IV pilus assembly protein PilY1
VAILTSGYDNSDGYGHLYLVNPKTGALLQEITTPTPSTGLAQATAFIPNYADYTADSVYVGDLDGQLWRFDLSNLVPNPDNASAPAIYPKPTLLATLTDASDNAQPITAAPEIEIDPISNNRFVMVGTGQLLNAQDTDISTTLQMQDFYAIQDGNMQNFSPANAPLTRSNLTPISISALGNNSTSNLPSGSPGWYLDLTGSNYNYVPPGTSTRATPATASSATGERVITQATANAGDVAFSTTLLTIDPCAPSVGNLYSINFATGKTVLSNNATYLSESSTITDMHFLSLSNSYGGTTVGGSGNTTKLCICTAQGVCDCPGAPRPVPGTTIKLLNWSEVPANGN